MDEADIHKMEQDLLARIYILLSRVIVTKDAGLDR
jgi:hypothetical protein